MFKKPHCPVIAIEEHYWDEELPRPTRREAGRPGEQPKRLHDFTGMRIKEMDEAGIDVQVISHGAPSTQKLPAETAAALTRRVNDRLHAAIAAQSAALRRLRRAADRGAARPPPTNSSAPRRRARLQGRHAARPRQRRLSRRQAVLADLRARRSARRADLSASGAAAAPTWRASITTITSRTFPWWRGRPGATRWRPRPPRSASCSPACSRNIRS